MPNPTTPEMTPAKAKSSPNVVEWFLVALVILTLVGLGVLFTLIQQLNQSVSSTSLEVMEIKQGLMEQKEAMMEEGQERTDAQRVSADEVRLENYTIDPNLCISDPVIADIGSPIYPSASEYRDLKFLGEFFTAYRCGSGRVDQLFGVKDGLYTLGSHLRLSAGPSSKLHDTLLEVGFECSEAIPSESCRDWFGSVDIPVDALFRLEPYADEFAQNDCTNCG